MSTENNINTKKTTRKPTSDNHGFFSMISNTERGTAVVGDRVGADIVFVCVANHASTCTGLNYSYW
jgi:hypothetical protein